MSTPKEPEDGNQTSAGGTRREGGGPLVESAFRRTKPGTVYVKDSDSVQAALRSRVAEHSIVSQVSYQADVEQRAFEIAAESLGFESNLAGDDDLRSLLKLEQAVSASRSNALGGLLLLSFSAFFLALSIFGEHAAGIAFWSVMTAVPTLVGLVCAVEAGWRGNRDSSEALRIATLALKVAEGSRIRETRRSENHPPSPVSESQD